MSTFYLLKVSDCCFLFIYLIRSLIGYHKHLSKLNSQKNNFYFKYFTTTCLTMTAKTALFIVAEGSEELELVAPVDILRRANVNILFII